MGPTGLFDRSLQTRKTRVNRPRSLGMISLSIVSPERSLNTSRIERFRWNLVFSSGCLLVLNLASTKFAIHQDSSQETGDL